MKKISILALTLITLIAFCTPVYAVDTSSTEKAPIEFVSNNGAKFTYITSASSSISISSMGGVTVKNSLLCVPSVDGCRISTYLKRLENGSWVTVKHWANDSSSYTCSLNKLYYVASGYYYKLVTYYYAYDDDDTESTSRTTSSKYY